jgi:hypothetical protein
MHRFGVLFYSNIEKSSDANLCIVLVISTTSNNARYEHKKLWRFLSTVATMKILKKNFALWCQYEILGKETIYMA